MRNPKIGDKIAQVVVIESEVAEILEMNHFTNSAKVRDNNGRILLITQRKTGDAIYQVVQELREG